MNNTVVYHIFIPLKTAMGMGSQLITKSMLRDGDYQSLEELVKSALALAKKYQQ